MNQVQNVGVLFVCLGNICRSPTCEGVFRQLIKDEKLRIQFDIDSAGTGGYHIGEPPDSRAIDVAHGRGVNLESFRARLLSRSDFQRFDYIIAMDRNNLRDINKLAPENYPGQITLFMDYAENWHENEVPDPYYGGSGGFERVLDMIEDASIGLLQAIKSAHY